MKLRIAPFFLGVFLLGRGAWGQVTVCDLFKDLEAQDGRQLIVTGDLLISRNLAVLGTADCDYEFTKGSFGWSPALLLKPSPAAPLSQLTRLREAATEADRLRAANEHVAASASFTGRVQVIAKEDGFPAELIFDSVQDLSVESLPNADRLPVIPICDLFENLPAWKDKRIAVRGETFSSHMDGSWLTGRCKGAFYTGSYRWPVSLFVGHPAYYSGSTADLIQVLEPSESPKGEEQFRGKRSVETATYIGRLRMMSGYQAHCEERGHYDTYGFGPTRVAAEIVLEEVRDVELSRPSHNEESLEADDQRCQPPNIKDLCAAAQALEDAAKLGCLDRVTELLATKGIDSKDGSESNALLEAIQRGDETLVKLLLEAGAPVNPKTVDSWPPLGTAADSRRINIMKMLLNAGASVDGPNGEGISYLPLYGFFNYDIAKVLLEAGANANARDDEGRTALMGAAYFGLGDTAELLLDHHAEVNLKDGKGRSALMEAASGPYADAIPLLIAKGADLHAKDKDGKTALDLAKASKNDVAVELVTAAMR